MELNLAILGMGRIGIVHAQAIQKIAGAKLVAIAEPSEKAAKSAQRAFGCDLRSIDQIADSDDIDGVIICTPTDSHADLIEKYAMAGKAIFCEKPIDLDAKRVSKCLDIVQKCKIKLMVGFNRRFDPDFMALKSAIDEGQIGDVEMITITSRDPSPPPYEYIIRSGGIFRDMTIHDFDMARWLFGEEVESVRAAASVLTDPTIGELNDYDSVSVILCTASGKQCTISNSRRATYGYDQRIEVHGSKGMVRAKNTRDSNIEIASSVGFKAPPLLNFFMTRYETAYTNEIAAFVKTIAQNLEPPTSGKDGLKALLLADAAVISVQTGKSIKIA